MPTPNPATAATALPELTLIVAATQQMGIGRNGGLPWTGLKREMAYFARVTKRLPHIPSTPPPSLSAVPNPGSSSAPASGTVSGPVSSSSGVQQQLQQQQSAGGQGQGQGQLGTGAGVGIASGGGTGVAGGLQNAVIMGRKTWESIPERFRPLAGRLNVVISRSAGASSTPVLLGEGKGGKDGGVVMAGSLEEALGYLRGRQEGTGLGRVFVIGGAQIYRAALRAREARRVLLTRVKSEFECDTFFPLRLEEGKEGEAGWKRSGQEEMDEWVGEEVPRGVQSENGTEYEFEMWERVD